MKKNLKPYFKLILRILIFVILIFFVILTFKKIHTKRYLKELETAEIEGKEEDKAEIVDEEKESEYIQKVKDLQKENKDIIGWLRIDGTKISYPLLQTKDNSSYMYRNYKKEQSNDGSLFLDKDYKWNPESANLLIYGHNNQNGKMFSDLIKYQKESYYKKHPEIQFTTNKEEREYQIIAVGFTKVYYKDQKNVFKYYNFINASNKDEFNEYINGVKDLSLYDIKETAKYGDEIITLSTCSFHVENGRFIVVGKRIK